MSKLSEYQVLVDACADCRSCGLCRTRRNVVFGCGCTKDTEVIILGEAPGRSEDITAMPFVGPAGKFLFNAISKAIGRAFEPIVDATYLTNVLCCRPCDSLNGPNRTPKLSEVAQCISRLDNLIRVLKPRTIIRLGLAAQLHTDMLMDEYPSVVINLPHPAALLRRGGTEAKDYGVYVETLRGVYGK